MIGRRRKKITKIKYEADAEVYGEHAPTVHDLITTADGIEVFPDELYVSPAGYTRIYYATALPSRLPFGYLQPYMRIGGADVTLSLHVEPGDSARAIAKRTKMMTRLHSEIISEDKAGTNKAIPFFREQYALLEVEREALRLGTERLLYVTILLCVQAPTRDALLLACEKIEREGFAGFAWESAYKEQDLAFRAIAPIGTNPLHHAVEMTSSALANAFPFSNSHFSHEFGVPIGIDFTNGHLNRYDAWHKDLENHNAVVIGKSGGGKSYFVKGLVARSAACGIRHVIIDYEGEYAALVRALGGAIIRLDSKSPQRINPFELESEAERQADGAMKDVVNVDAKIEEMERLVHSMAHVYGDESLDAYTSAVINDVLQTMYRVDFGFTEDPASLFIEKRWEKTQGDRLVLREKRKQPRFADFYAKLEGRGEEDPRLHEALMRLRRFLSSGTAGMFDTYSNVVLTDTPVISFDLSAFTEHSPIRTLAMRVALEWVMEKFVKKNPQIKKRVVIDEAQKMLEVPEHAQFLDNAFRRIRKRSGSAVAATQDYRIVAESAYGRGVVQNSETKILMRQDKLDQSSIMEQFGLEEHEFAELLGYTRGQARWVVRGEVFYNQLVAFPEEHELFTTSFVESAASVRARREGGNTR